MSIFGIRIQPAGKALLTHFCILGLLLFSDTLLAHERWILSPQQIELWNSKLRPELFSSFSVLNLSMISAFSLFIVGWVWLGFTGARELFPDLQARLASYGDHVPRILRVCIAWILLSSAFGAEPRFGVDPFTSPTFLAPDLELSQLSPQWHWLRWAEIFLGLTILFGIYVRVFSALAILLSLLGGYLYGAAILAYAGAFIGANIYLVMQGAGRHYVPLPTLPLLLNWQSWLANQPRLRAQAIMRILTGTTLLYLGVFFKVMQPNLSIAIISIYQLPILSLHPQAFTLFMALVEVSAGILMMAGVLLRPLSLFLILAFTVFALLLPETPTEHILFYGVVLSCLINSAGHLKRPEPRDKPANIVIVGGGLAALQAAIKIEKLIGQYSHVNITLLHDQANFLFIPFLPEVIGGTVQPGNVVNPLRRIVQQTQIVVGHLETIDVNNHIVIAKRKNNETLELAYDSLVLALTAKSSVSDIPGMTAHSCPIDSVADALRIRQRVLDLVEEAEFAAEPVEKARLLTFAVTGNQESAYGIAVEVSQILRAAESSYTVLRTTGWQIHLYSEPKSQWPAFETLIGNKRSRCLLKAGITEHQDQHINSVTEKQLFFSNGQSQAVGLVINTTLHLPGIPILGRDPLTAPFSVDPQLRLNGFQNIWLTEFDSSSEVTPFIFTNDLVELGQTAGFNAWAHSQGYAPHSFKKSSWFIQPYNMAEYSLCRLGRLIISGKPAWFISRLINLLSVPGLERNLRIIIDWFLVLAFRNDIAVLAQAPSEHLQKSHFKAGDEIFHQGDVGQFAYVVDLGQLKVIQDGRVIRQLGPGDYFGELQPQHLNRRAETVRCLSDCELRQLSQTDLKALIQSGWLMSKAIRNLKDYHADQPSPLGLKRLTYISKVNAILSEADILEIGRLSSINNRRIDITGVLIAAGDYFFQILEGEPHLVDQLLEKIGRDPRHCNVTVLTAEYGCEERLFSDWDMKTVAITQSTDLMLQAVGMMLGNIAESYHIIGRYTQPALLKLLTDGINPLTAPFKNLDKIVVSGCMSDFSPLTKQFSVPELIEVFNEYLEICSACFIAYGGQVARYSRSGIIAHFAPNQVDIAIGACADARQRLQALVAKHANGNISAIQFGFGIVAGTLIEGNIGSSIKMDYTVLGDSVDKALHLAAFARDTHQALAIDAAILANTDTSWGFQAVGEFEFADLNQAVKIHTLTNFQPQSAAILNS
ncbi:BLUF domain-containing protein [Methylomonas paludis]|uniref:NADH:ubiquinone reductase (non-electrogenic) n=1 Tax=Methylomonas paludis TaxID=1173101 RepID=A0A975MQB9_9GAMM|nr:BLUF domain-containing protein [Methylomonas paludis]QWF72088.1 BLUF domain-containing protein [Methylomonas paludis]